MLDLGCGHGMATVVLARRGADVTACDLSLGYLREARARAAANRVAARWVLGDGQRLPFADAAFDRIWGSAILHHLDLRRAGPELRRVLRPGGAIAFCGEPSRRGDRLAAYPKRAALKISPLWRRLVRADARVDSFDEHEAAEHDLEHVVDVHAFTPALLERVARAAGFANVRVSGEELVAGWFGWANRTLESTANPATVPRAWHLYAYRGYLALKALDDHLLEPRLPPAIFYNLLLSARNPEEAAAAASANGRVAAAG